MESRRARKKQRTRREIFDAAMALFARRGFAAVTIEQICHQADVARGTFFLHYPSKAALLLELDRRLAAGLADRLAEPRGSALGEYRTLVDALGERWRERPELIGALLREVLSRPADASSGGPDLRDLVEAIVRRGQERGEFRRNVSARLAATVFLTTSAAVLSEAGTLADRVSAEETRNQLLHALLHGLHEPKPRLKWKPPLAEKAR